jgi:hypothetical protein
LNYTQIRTWYKKVKINHLQIEIHPTTGHQALGFASDASDQSPALAN